MKANLPLSRWLIAAAVVIVGIVVATASPVVSFDLGRFEQSWFLWPVILALTTLALGLIMWPTLKFWWNSRIQRIEHVESLYGTEVIVEYCNRFWSGRSRAVRPGGKPLSLEPLDYDTLGDLVEMYKGTGRATGRSEEQKILAGKYLKEEFNHIVKETYGESNFRGAMVLLAASAGVMLFVAFEHSVMWAVQQNAAAAASAHFLLGIKLDPASVAAIFGAYTWVTSDIIYRYRLADLSSSDLNWYSLRFLVAIPIGVAIAQFSGFKVSDPNSAVSNTGAVLAFVISMFSLPRIQEILGNLLNRGTGVSLAAAAAPDAADVVIRLPGIDQRLADRLAAEGITTIAQIATCDPVRLSARANIPFNLMLEYIDAAILWQMVGTKALALREFGWTGASKVIDFAERRRSFRALPETLITAAIEDKAAGKALEDLRKDLKPKLEEAERIRGRAREVAKGKDPNLSDDAPIPQDILALEDPGGVLAEVDRLQKQEAAAASRANAAKRGLDEALDTAIMAATDAKPSDEIFKKIGDVAKMEPIAVQEVVAAVCENDYARRFVRELMRVSASQVAKSETAKDDAAVPREAVAALGATS